jgi:hypothetical protein
MADEVKIRVVLDTKDAQSALNSLGISGGGGAGGGGGGSTTAAAPPAGGLNVGKLLGIGAGLLGARALLSPLYSPTTSGLHDIISEQFGGLGAQFERFAFGNLPAEARASLAARKSVEDTFAYQAAQHGIAPQAQASYDAQFARNTLKEKGVAMFERDINFRLGGQKQAQQDGGIHLVIGAIADGFDHLGDKILSIFRNHR